MATMEAEPEHEIEMEEVEERSTEVLVEELQKMGINVAVNELELLLVSVDWHCRTLRGSERPASLLSLRF